jgi:6-phosphofructokinase 1
VIGFSSGYTGLIHKQYVELKEKDLSGILTLGGTIIGTSREKPFKIVTEEDNDKPDLIKQNYHDLGLDGLVCIGGNGTMKTANLLSKIGLNVIGIPKTIDNDVWGTDMTFGFDSAVNIATEAVDRLHSTANSHGRVMIVEVMGHNAGWIALYAGMAGGGDIILIPEIEYSMDKVCDKIQKRYDNHKPYTIVVVAEGIEHPKSMSAARYLAESIQARVDAEARETVLGYTQRGGSPSPMDRILATRYGAHAAKCIAEGNFGTMVALIKNELTTVPLSEVGGKMRLVDPDNPLVLKCRSMGVSFGDE